MSAQQFLCNLSLLIPNSDRVISAAGEHLLSIGRKVAETDGIFVTMVLFNRLQAMERLLVPALILDNIGHSNECGEDKYVTARRVTLYAFQVVAHVLFFFIWLQDHNIVVNVANLCFKVDNVDTAAEGSRDH